MRAGARYLSVRRTLVRAVLFGSALGGLIFENSAVAGAQSRCAGGRTLSETSKYRLFARDDIYFACLRSTGIEAELRGVYEDEELRRFKVSGRYFVYEAGSSSSSGDDSWLDSVDMKTGRWARITEDDPVRFVVRATGSAGTDTKRLSIFVLAPLQLGGPTGTPYAKEPVPLNVKVNSPFPWGVKATGGKAPYTYTAEGLPTGLTLGQTDGLITGTPALAGVYRITFRVADALGGSDTMTATLNVKALLAFSKTGTPPVRAEGSAFRWKVPVAGASKTRMYLLSGAVPPGLSLDEATGILSGTLLQAGSYRIKLWVLGDSGTQISKSFTIRVTP